MEGGGVIRENVGGESGWVIDRYVSMRRRGRGERGRGDEGEEEKEVTRERRGRVRGRK